MRKPLIMFVDDEPNVLNGLKRFCRSQRHIWDMQFMDGGEAALEALHQQPVDVVVSDMRMPGVNGADLFEQISLHWPGIIRIMLSGEAEPDQTMRTVGRSHRFLAKPCEPAALIRAIEAPLQMQQALNIPAKEQQSSYLDRLQTPSALFDKIQSLLDQDSSSEQELAELISQDAALSARMLQLANSAYFGRPVATYSLLKAVETIGSNRIAKLLSLQRLGNHESSLSDKDNGEQAAENTQFGTLCQQYCTENGLPSDQQDLIFAVGLFLELGLSESEKTQQEMAMLPAYMVTLLGLPDNLASLLRIIADGSNKPSDATHRLETIHAALKHHISQAA